MTCSVMGGGHVRVCKTGQRTKTGRFENLPHAATIKRANGVPLAYGEQHSFPDQACRPGRCFGNDKARLGRPENHRNGAKAVESYFRNGLHATGKI